MESRRKWKRPKDWIFNNAKIRGNEGDGTDNVKIKKGYSSSRNASWFAEGYFSAEGNQQMSFTLKYYMNWSKVSSTDLINEIKGHILKELINNISHLHKIGMSTWLYK